MNFLFPRNTLSKKKSFKLHFVMLISFLNIAIDFVYHYNIYIVYYCIAK